MTVRSRQSRSPLSRPRRWSRLAGALCGVALLASTRAFAGSTVYAAGDIAECNGPASESDAAHTAALIPTAATVLVLGDSAYPSADRATLAACYDPTWGRFRAHTYAVAGNHDYVNGSPRDFLSYFGAPTPRRTWFRVAIGDWWVIGLDSDLRGSQLARQQAWLARQLAEIEGDGRCLLAMWHHALFSTGLHKGDGEPMRASWRLLDAAGADVVLSGHEHYYESFDPLDADGKPQADGIREFIVGTGGAGLRDLSLSSRHRAYAHVFGVLELQLEADRYQYAFHTVDGGVGDRGEARCRRPLRAVSRH